MPAARLGVEEHEQLRESAAGTWQRFVAAIGEFMDAEGDDQRRAEAAEAAYAAMEEMKRRPLAALIPTDAELDAMTPEEEAWFAGVPWHEQPAPVAVPAPAPVPRTLLHGRPRKARRRVRVRSGSRGDPPSPSPDEHRLTRRPRGRPLGVRR
jgi:hypothetical protein